MNKTTLSDLYFMNSNWEPATKIIVCISDNFTVFTGGELPFCEYRNNVVVAFVINCLAFATLLTLLIYDIAEGKDER